jgi:hypothetical protein
MTFDEWWHKTGALEKYAKQYVGNSFYSTAEWVWQSALENNRNERSTSI